jgi:hypothetical protein
MSAEPSSQDGFDPSEQQEVLRALKAGKEPDMLAAALAYAHLGIRVFPLYGVRKDGSCACGHADCTNIGKHPRTRNGLLDATTSETKIQKWWKMWPEDNIAGRMGSKIIALDPDSIAGMAEAHPIPTLIVPCCRRRTAPTSNIVPRDRPTLWCPSRCRMAT